MKLSNKGWGILAGAVAVLTVGLVYGMPKGQDYFYVRGIKQGSVNTFVAPGGTIAVTYKTLARDKSIFPNAYFRIDWKETTSTTWKTQDMKSNAEGIATATLPAGEVRPGWTPASGDFYLPYSDCFSVTKSEVCPVTASMTINVFEGYRLGS